MSAGGDRRLSSLLLIAFAIAAVAGQLLMLPAEPNSLAFNDELHYAQHARDIVQGHFPRYNRVFEPFVPPLYGLVLAPARLVGGSLGWPWWSRVVNVLLLVSALWPLTLLARRFLAPLPAAIAAIVSVAAPSQIYLRYVLSENLYLPLFLWLLLAVTRVCERPTAGRAFVAGLALAACYLTKTLVIATAPAIPLALLWATRSFRRTLVACVCLALGALALYGPWALRGLVFPSEHELVAAFSYVKEVEIAGRQPVGAYLGWTWATATCFVVGLGSLVFVLGTSGLFDWTASRDPARRGFAALSLVSAAGTLAMTAIATTQWAAVMPGKVHERYLIAYWPVFVLAFVACATGMRPSRTSLAIAGALLVVMVVWMPQEALAPGSKMVNAVDYPSSGVSLALGGIAGSARNARWLYALLALPALLTLARGRRVVAPLLLALGAGYLGWGAVAAMRQANRANAWAEGSFRPVWNWLDGVLQEGDLVLHHRLPPNLAYHDALRYEMDYCQLHPNLVPDYPSTVRIDKDTQRYRFVDRAPLPRLWLMTDAQSPEQAPGELSRDGMRLIPLEDGKLPALEWLGVSMDPTWPHPLPDGPPFRLDGPHRPPGEHHPPPASPDGS